MLNEAITSGDVNPSKVLKRSRHDDQDPPVGSNKENKKKRKRKDSKPSKDKEQFGSSPKGKTQSKPSSTDKSVNAKKTIHEVAIKADESRKAEDDVVNDEPQLQDDASPTHNNSIWFKQDARPESPDPEWHKEPNADDAPKQTWFNELVNAQTDPLTFDDLMGSTVDFTKFAMHHFKKDRITRADIALSRLTNHSCEFFFNNDLEYLKTRNKERKYASSLTKIKAARSRNNARSRHEVFSRLKILSDIRISVDKQFGYGYLNEIVVRRADQKEYTFREADFERLHLNDIEDMFLLYVQHKLHNLTDDEIVDIMIALRMFTRSIFIKRRVEDVQLGVESYQKKLSITRPQTTCDGISYKEPYTTVYEPRGVVYKNKSNQKRLIQAYKLYTLKSVCEILNVRLHNFVLGYNADIPKRAWTDKDRIQTDDMLMLIDNMFLERRIMWSLECFVGGRTIETDYRLLTQTKNLSFSNIRSILYSIHSDNGNPSSTNIKQALRGLDVCVDLTGSSPLTQTGLTDFLAGHAVVNATHLIMEYLVKISKKARILELKRRHLKITVLTPNMPYPSRKIHRICTCTSPNTTKDQDAIASLFGPAGDPWHQRVLSQSVGKDLVSGLLVYELPLNSLWKKYRLSLKNDMPPRDKKLLKTLNLDESRSPEFNLFSDLEEYSEEEVAETMAETMEQYMSKTRADYGSGIARPKIDDKDSFELKGQILKELRDNTFSSSDHEDANKHIEKVLEIVDLFHIPNITQDQVMLRAFLMSLTGAASHWLRNKPSCSITTWEDLKTKFLSKYCPPVRTAKKMEEINNFQQEPDETLSQAWEQFKELLMKCPQHYLTEMQEKVNEKVYAAQVGCEQCKGTHNTKDCPLKEEGKTLEEAYYTQFGGPFQGGGYRAAAPGFYQRNNANPSYKERRQSMEETLRKFMSDSTKRHEENSNMIKEIRASTDAAVRNQGASIKTLEIQIGQISRVLHKRGFGSLPSSTEANPRDHVKLISTTAEADSNPIRRIGSPQYAEKKRSYGPQFSEAYSYGASSIDNCILRKEKDPRIVKNMDGYRDQDMGDVILGEPFCKTSCVEARRLSKKARILELKRRYLKITVLTSNTPYPSRKIRRICACTSPKTTKDQGSKRRNLLKRIQKFSVTQDIGARAAVHIFNRINFATGRNVFRDGLRMREEVQTCRNQTAQLNALIAEMEAFDDPGEVFDMLMGLKDDVRVEDAKLIGLNDLISYAEEEIEMKEAQLEVANGVSLKLYPIVSHGCEVMSIWTFSLADGVDVLLTMAALYILDKLVDSSRLQDKMKIIFMQARGSDESFIALMRDLCSALRLSIAKNWTLIAELEALGQRAEALKPLDYMKEIVGRDSATLGVLEQLLVGMLLKWKKQIRDSWFICFYLVYE
ncbi:hypothetical protein Tco_0494207 [Tanacetum coccineum]